MISYETFCSSIGDKSPSGLPWEIETLLDRRPLVLPSNINNIFFPLKTLSRFCWTYQPTMIISSIPSNPIISIQCIFISPNISWKSYTNWFWWDFGQTEHNQEVKSYGVPRKRNEKLCLSKTLPSAPALVPAPALPDATAWSESSLLRADNVNIIILLTKWKTSRKS